MSFSLMPVEISYHIVSFIFIQPIIITSVEIKAYAQKVKNIYMINNTFNQIFSEKMVTLKKIYDLVNKYYIYNANYEKTCHYLRTNKENSMKGNPQLLDALFTGCTLPCAISTFSTYSLEIEADIKEIVKLMPQSMNCIIGTFRCRSEVTPLVVACCNDNIPIHIIEFLLKEGADPYTTLKLNGCSIKILDDLKDNIGKDRFIAIEKLFKKYSNV